MEIRCYDEVDPLSVLRLNMTVLGFPLTPALAAALRQHDHRFQDCLCFYAVVDGALAGQAGLLINDVETLVGPMRFGAAWAVCTLPCFARQGVARALMQKVQEVATQQGCTAITLVTNRTRVAHQLYQSLGYVDFAPVRQAFSFQRASGSLPDTLALRRVNNTDLPYLEQTFFANTNGLMGFVRRQESFLRANVQTELDIEAVLGVYRSNRPIGYVISRKFGDFLRVQCAVLPTDVSLSEVLMHLRKDDPTPFVVVADLVQAAHVHDLEQNGYQVEESWGSVMLKPLDPSLDFRHLLGVAEERFFIDSLDFT